MRRTFHQLKVLFFKNWLLQSRHPKTTAVEFIVPAVLSALLLIGRVKVEPIPVQNVTRWDSFGLDPGQDGYSLTPWSSRSSNLCQGAEEKPLILAFSPNTNLTVDFMTDIKYVIQSQNGSELFNVDKGILNRACWFTGPKIVELKAFDTSKELDDYMVKGGEAMNVFYGVDFQNAEWNQNGSLPKTLDYALRPVASPRSESSESVEGRSGWLTNLLFSRRPAQNGPTKKNSEYGGKPFYYKDLFLEMQHIIDYTFIAKAAAKENKTFDMGSYRLQFERFPFPPYSDDEFIVAISQQLPLVILLSFVYIGVQAAKNIAIEKESRLKEYMLMMGLGRTALWTSWFIHYFLMIIIPVALVTIILCAPFTEYGSILQYSNWFLVFVFLLLWGTSLITLGFLISTWFSSANSTSAASGILIFVAYLPYGFINQNLDDTPAFATILASLLSPVDMSFGCFVIASWEARGEGAQWSNLSEPISVSNNISMLRVMIFLIIDTVLYYGLTRYFDLVKSGDWGISLPWYFCFTKSYWCPLQSEPIKTEKTSEKSLVETLPQNIEIGFQLKNVVKEFQVKKEKKRAVDDLTFTAVANEITVLLGHNGAGKSTTMNMLTGMLSADSGDCYVGGINVAKDLNKARKTVGLCPQHNILIKEMTVKEHFLFFAQLKGFTKDQAEKEQSILTGEVQLEDKTDVQASALSGGMKRKLSLGIAVCGGSKHLILDEPSSGIDVTARRELWSILEKYRSSRSMLISTHYMDEAEALADRIVIIGKGALKCAGSTAFLKQQLGDGYHLTLSLKEGADIDQVTQFIKSKADEAQMATLIGNEAEYVLPFSSASKFPELFRSLDSKETGVESYGASITTMDEIFLKVTKDDGAGKEDEGPEEIDEASDEEILQELSKSVQLLEGRQLFMQQFRGAFIKCFLHAIRNWKIILLQLLLPTIMTVFAVVQILSIPEIGAQPELDLSLKPYKDMNKLDISTPYEFVDTARGAILENILEKESTPVEETDVDFSSWIPNQIEKEQSSFNKKYILAFESESTAGSNLEMKTWFNAEAYHGIAAGVFYADQLVLKDVLGDDYSILTSNHPLPPNSTEAIQKNVNFFIQGSVISFNLIIGVMIMFGSFSVLPVRERSTGVRTLQKCSGAPLWLTWLAEYVWDILNCIPSLALILIIFAASKNVDGISDFVDNADCIAVLFILFTLAQLPFCYSLSFAFDQPSSAITYSSLINVILALGSFLTVFILRILPDTKEVGEVLNDVFCIFPQFNFAMGLFDIYYNANIVKGCTSSKLAELACKAQNVTYSIDPWAVADGGIGRYTISLAIEIPALFALLYLVEWESTTKRIRSTFKRCLKTIKCKKNKKQIDNKNDEETDDIEDDDVAAMTKSITMDEGLHKDDINALIVDGLKKDYIGENGIFHAVKSVSFTTKRGECFGLLGPNGAGKTTTFKMLTGEHDITAGNAFIDHIDISTDRLTALRRFGYCPQFDALLEQLTGKETLRMYSRLRGVPEEKIEGLIIQILKLVGIEIHAEKQVRGYSGGTKRKLSVGIALVGFPPLLLMDEPSCGLDPGARRKLWNVISGAQKVGAAVLLTSHSMEECAALCNKLAIMVNGKFKCIGGQQHLKSKFGEGAEVEIQAGSGDVNEISSNALQRIPGLTVKDKFQGAVKFVASRDTKLADIFEQLESLKMDFPIGGYTVNQATLEQIFLALTKYQKSSDH